VHRLSFWPGRVTLAQALGVSDLLLVLPLAVVFGVLFWRWHRRGMLQRPAFAAGYLQPWRAAVLLAGIGLVSVLAVGMPLGVTTSYAKVAAWLEAQVFPAHAAGLAYFAARPLDYPVPLTGMRLTGGGGPQFDGIAVIQFPLIAGIVLGAAGSAYRLGELRLAPRPPLRQALAALAGGLLMGVASRLAPGCNVWHIWGGLPILALSSLLFVAGLLPGTWLGCRLLLGLVVAEERAVD
jgi:hypothetical protein